MARFYKGQTHTPEVRKKMSLAKKGKPSPKKGVPTGKPARNSGKKGLQVAWNKGLKGVMPEPRNKGTHFEQVSGDKNHFWKGGVSKTNRDERRQIHITLEYVLFRRGVFERDNFTCVCCGISGGYVEAHHLNNFKDFPEFRTIVDNGVTLCKICHKHFHKIYGTKNNTKEQFNEFLNAKQNNNECI